MSSHSSNIQKIKDKQRKEIRRQYIESLTKNRRKQIMEQLQSQTKMKNQSEIENEYENYFSTFNFETFKQQPNNHLQYLVEILSSSNSKIFRNRLYDMLITVHRYLIEKFSEERTKIEYLRGTFGKNEEIKDNGLLNDIVVDILVYNEVFFESLFASKQQKFSPENSKSFENNVFEQMNVSEEVSGEKLNLGLVLDFLVAMMYEITPDIFITSIRAKNFNHIKSLNNGYDELLNNHNCNNIFPNFQNLTTSQNENKNEQLEITQLIRIFNDIYNMTLTLYKITFNFRYYKQVLSQLSIYLHRIYNDSNVLIENMDLEHKLSVKEKKNIKNNYVLPILWFDCERMFIREEVKNSISLKCLQIFVNMTALISMNPELDNFIHKLIILSEIETLAQENGFTQEEISLFINLYSNLVEEEITWTHEDNGKKYQQFYQNKLTNTSIDEEIDNQHMLQQPPGVYVKILELMAENADTEEELDYLVFILKVILENYEVPSREENIRIQTDIEYLNAENSQLILSFYHCEYLASIIYSLFEKIKIKQFEIGQLSNLYIQVVDKMLTYFMYLHQLPEILSLVIKNENKRIVRIQEKSHSSLNSILSETQEKQKKIITQNLKKILIKTTELISLFAEETSETSINLNYSHEAIPKDLIDGIMALWEQNEIEHCYSQFLEFILTTVQYFPQYFILTENKERNEHFLLLVEEIPSDSSHLNKTSIFIEILEFTLQYIQNYESNSKIQTKNYVLKYLIDFRYLWSDILQHLEGLLYSENPYQKENRKNDKDQSNEILKPKFHEKVENLYETIDFKLKSALENMEIEI